MNQKELNFNDDEMKAYHDLVHCILEWEYDYGFSLFPQQMINIAKAANDELTQDWSNMLNGKERNHIYRKIN